MELHIFCGHFGSGKTEVALNFAIKNAKEQKRVAIVDLDIVNPYFRTNDARAILESNGIDVIAPEYANTNLDMPLVPADIMRAFNENFDVVVFDVGGDEDGAYALGRYKPYFSEYKMHLVVNAKRPLTETKEEILQMASEIENASRLKITDFINNTNLAKMSDKNTIIDGFDVIEESAKAFGVDVSMYCATEGMLDLLPEELTRKKFTIDIKIKMPWEN